MSDEIIQAYIKYSNIGWTKSFDFIKVLEKYKSKSQEISAIQQYKVMIGKFYLEQVKIK